MDRATRATRNASRSRVREREEDKREREALERSGKRAKVSEGKASKAPSVQAGADVVPAGDGGGCDLRGGGAAFGKVSAGKASKAPSVQAGADVVPAGDEGACALRGGGAAFGGGSLTAGCNECNELRMQVLTMDWEVKTNVEKVKHEQEKHDLTLRVREVEHKSEKKELEAKNAALEGRQKDLEAANERLVLENGQKIPKEELDALKQSLQRAEDALALKKQECSELESSRKVLMEEKKRTEAERDESWKVRQNLQRAKAEVAAKQKMYDTAREELKTALQELERTSKDLYRVKLQLEGENAQHAFKCKEYKSVKLALENEERLHATKREELKKAMQDLGVVKMELEAVRKASNKPHDELGGARREKDRLCAGAQGLTSENKERQAGVATPQGLQSLIQKLEDDKQALMAWVGQASGEVVVERARNARAGASNVLQGADGELQRGEQGRESGLGDKTAPPAGIGSVGGAPGAFAFKPDEQGRESRLGDKTAPPAGIGSFGGAPGAVAFRLDEPDGELQRGEQGREGRLGDKTAPPAGIGSFGGAPGVGAAASKSVQHPQSKPLCFKTGYMFMRGKPGKSTNGGRDFPCDDALVASKTVIVVCDGVSAGGPKSGDLGRAVATAALQRAERCEGSIRAEFQKTPLQSSNVCSVLHEAQAKKASTTVTIVKVHNGDCQRIEAIEVGDSQLALVRKLQSNEFQCRYLSKRKMYLDDPGCPLQLDTYRNLPFFLTRKVSESNVCSEVPVEEGDFLIVGSDGLWDNLNEGWGILTYEGMKEQLESFFKVNHAWWASNKKDKEPFVNFVGRALRDAVVQRMSGPQISSINNKRTKSADDVTFYVGTLKPVDDEALRADSSRGAEGWLFASDNLSHGKIAQGVQLDSTTTNEYIESLLVREEIKQVEDRFEGYKVDMCRHKERCYHGNHCVFAHSESELRCLRWTRHACVGGCNLKHGTDDPEVARTALEKFRVYKAKRTRANVGLLGRGGH